MLTFSYSEVKKFLDFANYANSPQRIGQLFWDHFKLHKITNPEDKQWCDRLYEMDKFYAMMEIYSRTDFNQ